MTLGCHLGDVLGWAVMSDLTRVHMENGPWGGKRAQQPPVWGHGTQDVGAQGSVTFCGKVWRQGAGCWCSWPGLAILFVSDCGLLSVYFSVQWGFSGAGNMD